MTNKIVKSEFKRKWGEGTNVTYYHDVQFEGDSKTYNIGAKAENPPFLHPGNSLEWEWKDQAKNSIKRAQKPFGGGGGGAAGDPVDIKISTGIICATIMLAAGKITSEQFMTVAKRSTENFQELKDFLK